MTRNILFIMCDQLRYDYLGCAGHPSIRTPHIDALAARGVRFDRAYVQSPICGPSRMSFYTGRYVSSHGSTWNMSPLRVGEMNFGDHLNPLGMRTALCGKTHMAADTAGMARLGLDPQTQIGVHVAQCGFEYFDWLDGIHPPGSRKKPSHYNAYLNAQGFEGDDPWQHWTNDVQGAEGAETGWLMANAGKPARVPAAHSETAYTARRARDFIQGAGDDRWCLHLSFIKPHWPYVAPAPYHAMYGADDVMPPRRDSVEKRDPHPVLDAYHRHRFSEVFAQPGVRETVIPTYMGLISQIDDEIGALMAWLQETGRADETMIVFTSDHGDYLGDHWLGEKELFHDPSVRIPLIIMDPSPQADATRGMVCDALVEAIDLLPTFVEVAGGTVADHVLEGCSLVPLLRDPEAPLLRDCVFSEYDYSYRLAREMLKVPVRDCRLQMVFDGTWKMIRAEGFAPMLFNLEKDPEEFHDLGRDETYAAVIARLTERLLSWATRHHARVTRSDEEIRRAAGGEYDMGILIGFYDEDDVAEARDKGHGGN